MVESKIYVEADKIIALSEGMKNEISKIENDKDKIVVITNLCDTKNFNINKNWKKFRRKYLELKMSL